MRTDVLAVRFHVTRAQAEALLKFLQRGDIAAQNLGTDGDMALSELRIALRDIIEPGWFDRARE